MSPAVARAESNVPEPVGPPPTPGTHATSARPAVTRKAPDDRLVTVVLLGLPLAVTAWGWSYYVLPFGARLRHPLHALLRPSGTIGLGMGIAALALFLFLWLYAIRKSAKWLAWTGAVGSWMRVHVVAGLLVPLVGAVHAGWRFEGFIGLGYLSMFIVSLSGIVGRFLYTHIPRQVNGLEMSRDEVAGERRSLLTRIGAATGLEPAAVERLLAVDDAPYEGLDPLRTLVRMVRDDWRREAHLKQLRREWSRPRPGARPLERGELKETLRLARREMALAQQVRVLEGVRMLFGWWHVAHRPFAITALLAVLAHVVVALVVGAVGLP